MRLANLFIFAFFGAIPLVAHYKTADPTASDGIGFDILLYQPFDHAYAILVLVVLIYVNVFWQSTKASTSLSGLLISVAIFVAWYFATFLALGQLHLSLGGQL